MLKIFSCFLIFIFVFTCVFLSSSNASQATAVPLHLVISEVQMDSIDGTGGTYDDFVELYNPTDSLVDLSGWSMQRAAPGGTISDNVALAGSIPAYGFYLIVRDHDNTDLLLKGLNDLLTDFSLQDNNSVLLVSNIDTVTGIDDPDIVDLLGMGAVAYFETTAYSELPDGKSLERKSGEVNNELQGNGWDTDNNTEDFFVNDNPEPQNIQSAPEVPEWAQNGDGEDGEVVKSLREIREMREMRDERDKKDIRQMQLQDKTEKLENTIREMRSLRDIEI